MPVESGDFSNDSLIFEDTVKHCSKIKMEFDNLKDAFTAANIDLTEFFCLKNLTAVIVDQAFSIPFLGNKVIHFR